MSNHHADVLAHYKVLQDCINGNRSSLDAAYCELNRQQHTINHMEAHIERLMEDRADFMRNNLTHFTGK